MPSAKGLSCVPGNPQMYGRDSLASADQVRQQRENRNDWPYEHIFPPSNAIPVNAITQTPVAIAAPATVTEVLKYTVESGMRFIMTGIIENAYQGNAVTFTPGDGFWTVDKNTPVGISSTQKMPVQGLVNTPVPLGSFLFGVIWQFKRPYEFEALDVVRSKFVNVNLASGAPNYLMSAFLGYLLPVTGNSR